MSINDVLSFWFVEIDSKLWFQKSQVFDNEVKQRFASLHLQATRCELFSWRKTARGRLAEILILDQFSRNIYRDQPLAFAHDALALCLAQEAIRLAEDKALSAQEKSFMYMPYMHSESSVIHEEALRLFDQDGLESNYEYELKHKRIIDQFGRYPHRNSILGRVSSPAELAFLQEPGSSF